MLNEAYYLVQQFQNAAGQPVRNTPQILSKERQAIRYEWLSNELDEFVKSNTIYDQADSIIDLIYYAIGTLVEMGVEPDELFNLIHSNNMKKLSSPIFDTNGRVLKPKGWQHPDEEIKHTIDRYMTRD